MFQAGPRPIHPPCQVAGADWLKIFKIRKKQGERGHGYWIYAFGSGESTQIRQATEFRERAHYPNSGENDAAGASTPVLPSIHILRQRSYFLHLQWRYSPERSPNPNPNSPFMGNGRSRSLSKSRFSPSSFIHNARIAIALVPCAAFLLDLGGTPVVATLTLGLMIAYILDSLNFKSVQVDSNREPSIVLALERLLFACVPFVASALFAWATISAVGMNNASYYLMAFNCVFYWVFSIPRISSFKNKQEVGYHGGEVPDDILILGPLESCFHTLNLLFFPLVFHIASHYSVMFLSAASVSDLFLLFFIPFLFLLYASTRGALWWVTKNAHQLQSIRVVNGAIALVVVVICLEIRVVFHSFGRYIQVPPPLNYLLVTTTMLGGASAAGAYAVGMIGDAFSSLAFTALAVLVSAAGAIVVGFPILV
ncbi:hypothetical protein CK203_044895 [Vitis vinifera]|uniref:Uncharacterized protein n=1 Tax=Vitis vinifera TaxID=29760 RepID=A0A438H0V1_VITVI|nr:hypothetical protein CK203_044895 [Vitis vinifera]